VTTGILAPRTAGRVDPDQCPALPACNQRVSHNVSISFNIVGYINTWAKPGRAGVSTLPIERADA